MIYLTKVRFMSHGMNQGLLLGAFLGILKEITKSWVEGFLANDQTFYRFFWNPSLSIIQTERYGCSLVITVKRSARYIFSPSLGAFYKTIGERVCGYRKVENNRK